MNKEKVTCCPICKKENYGSAVQCDRCDEWMHTDCVGLTLQQAQQMKVFVCNACKVSSASQRTFPDSLLQLELAALERTDMSFANTCSSTLIPTETTVRKTASQLASNGATFFTSTRKPLIPDAGPSKVVLNQKLNPNTKSPSNKDARSQKSSSTKRSNNKMKIKLLLEKCEILKKREKLLEETIQLIDEDDSEQEIVNSVENDDIESLLFSQDEEKADMAAQLCKIEMMSLNERVDKYLNPNADDFKPTTEVGFKPNERKLSNEQEQPNVTRWQARQTIPKHLPKFSGSANEWALFINAYEASTSICGFSNYENLLRLQECLMDPAKSVVRHLLTDPSNVDTIIRRLRQLYGHPQRIIEEQMAEIRRHEAVNGEEMASIVQFALAVNNVCASIRASGLLNHMNNPMLLNELVGKLCPALRLQWAQESSEMSDIAAFEEWLDRISTNICMKFPTLNLTPVKRISKLTTEDKNLKTRRMARLNVHSEEQNKEGVHECYACDNECSSLSVCKTFLDADDDYRWKVIRQNKLCKQCLKRHEMKPPFICKDFKKCGVSGCNIRHHTLIHRKENPASSNTAETKGKEETTCTNQIQNEEAVFRYLPVVLRNGVHAVRTIAFLDQGSSGTFIESSLARQMNLKGPVSPLRLKFTGNTHRTEHKSMIVSVSISGVQSNAEEYQLDRVHTVTKLALSKQSVKYEELVDKYEYLRGLPIESYDEVTPGILIGLNNWKLVVEREIRLEGDGPIASNCSLGWSVYAGKPRTQQAVNYCEEIECIFHVEGDTELNAQVKHYFSLDSLGVREPIDCTSSKEDLRALEILERDVKQSGDKFETSLLWKADDIRMPENKMMAVNRMKSLEQRFQKNPDLADNVKRQMHEYLKKGYVRKLTDEELEKNFSRVWYLPIFPVLNHNKPGKVRIVFDARAEVDGVSLNSMLLTGPDNLSSLFGVLLRFRQRAVALTGDITEMFHQIKMKYDDQQVQRFVWREDESNQFCTYVLQVMTFGATCSPSIAEYVKNYNAKKYEVDHKQAVDAIVNDTYVDDLLTSTDTAAEMIQLATDIKMIHAKAGFEIGKWQSNSRDVMKALDVKFVNQNVDMNIDQQQEEMQKVLGMWWCLSSDNFTYSLKYNKSNIEVLQHIRRPTKREMLRTLMSIYDILGLISPFTSYLKVLLQDVWRTGVDWDVEIDDKHEEKWKIWLNALPQLELLKIPRCYLKSFSNYDGVDVQLHVFVDASEENCCAVAYLRTHHERDNVIEVSIVAAKTRVAPLKLLSIPRLELISAVIGARLGNVVVSSLTIKIKKLVFWSDSKTVLSWIRSDTKKIKGKFVAFRVSEIQDTTDPSSWRFVPSRQNVADDATKWKRNLKMNSDDRWFTGPEFLYRLEDEWPNDSTIDYGTREEMILGVHQEMTATIDFERFSKFKRAVRTMAMVFKFVKILKTRLKKENESDLELNSENLMEAQIYMFKQAQCESYSEEISSLRAKGSVNRTSKLYKFSPYLDEDGLIRVRGRIDAATYVPFETRRPIILPPKHRVTLLVVREIHEKYLHLQHETVINELRKKYAIPGIRRLLNAIRHDCNHCAYLRAKPVPPQMSPLPYARVAAYSRPFSYVGVDCLGPIEVVVQRKHVKRWICLYTCLTIRAVHLEILHNMDTESFLLCFRNFTQRRGEPVEVYSDNGTNFVGAERLLRENLKNLDVKEIARAFNSPEMKWSFNPPDSPHMGGSWERLVKSVKNAFYATIPARALTDPLLQNYMIEIENMINSRPLTHIPMDTEQDDVLTPNHFLIGYSGGGRPLILFDDEVKFVKQQWKLAQLYAQRYWQRWVNEYLPELTKTSKWFEKAEPLKEGDLVLVVDPRFIRNCWLRGKVISVKTSADGQVRSAEIQTKNGVLKRPAVKLAKLDITENGDSICQANSTESQGGIVKERTQACV